LFIIKNYCLFININHLIYIIVVIIRVISLQRSFLCKLKFIDENNIICINPYYSAPSKNKIFRIFFWILNMFAIVSNLHKKKLFFVKTPKNNFSDPQTTNLNKPVGNIFDRRDPKKPPLNWSFPTKWYPCLLIPLFCYSCAIHNNLA
jgi:hypothetical protein